MKNFEKIRQEYKPKKIDVLFIAESPPSGETFFYLKNSNLYFAVKEGFKLVFGQFGDIEFLDFFKEKKCYIEDLCLIPVNGLKKEKREEERNKGIGPLAKRIREIKPKVIIILMKGIESKINAAIEESNIQTIEYIQTTSFPAHSERNRQNCITGVHIALTESLKRGIIKNAT